MEIAFHGNLDVGARAILIEEITNHFEVIKLPSKKLSVFFDFPAGSKTNPNDFNVLLMHEPRSVIPWQYQSHILSQFQLLIPFSPWRSEVLGCTNWAFHPYRFSGSDYSSEASRNIWISMINASKFSSGTTSNYGLRREVSKLLNDKGLDFKLYGWGWNSSWHDELRRRIIAFRNSFVAREDISWRETFSTIFHKFGAYQSGVVDKFEILHRSELHLIIENDSDWITEKLFDAFTTRTVPVYVGPSFQKFLPVLEQCIIRCEANAYSIMERVKQITPEEVELKRAAIQNLMINNSLLQEIDYQFVWRKVSQMIISELKSS
jgi:hypothetical protein